MEGKSESIYSGLEKYKINENSNFEKFKATHIPPLPSNMRNSVNNVNLNEVRNLRKLTKSFKRKWSEKSEDDDNVRII